MREDFRNYEHCASSGIISVLEEIAGGEGWRGKDFVFLTDFLRILPPTRGPRHLCEVLLAEFMA